MPLFLFEIIILLIFLIFLLSQLILPYFGFFNGVLWWLFKKPGKITDEKVSELHMLDIKKEHILLDKEIEKKKCDLDNLSKGCSNCSCSSEECETQPEEKPKVKRVRKKKIDI
jgi:hypothetical protein